MEWDGCKLVNSSNQRESRFVRSGRASKQRQGALHRVANNVRAFQLVPKPPYRVTIIRLSPRMLDADDNLNIAAKSIRDGVADALGINDGNEKQATWKYGQEQSKRHGVRIEIVAC